VTQAGARQARSGNGVHRCRHRRHCRGEDVNLRDRTGSGCPFGSPPAVGSTAHRSLASRCLRLLVRAFNNRRLLI
jgi:hypothetical protein